MLVLAPTRELVIQIRSVAEKLTSRARGALTVAAVYGGDGAVSERQEPGFTTPKTNINHPFSWEWLTSNYDDDGGWFILVIPTS